MAIDKLLNASSDNCINVRSYEPYNPQSREFIYGIRSTEEAVAAVERLSDQGLYTIVNETIDVHDGGVSGVLMGDVLEFAPDDTPRCVEKPGTASLPRSWGRELFTFGRLTKAGETWIRTAPLEQVPGKYTTHHGWLDPFRLMINEDPENESIMSVLAQHGVVQKYSGALIVGNHGQLIIEGKKGEGETFMLGESSPEQLPKEIVSDIVALYERANALLGTVRFEWVHDGEMVWILQLHAGATESDERNITPLKASQWQVFDTKTGPSELRKVIQNLPNDVGIELVGKVGLTSHFADVLRRAKIPARMR